MSKKNKGIFFIIVSSFCFALMSTFVKLSGDIPSIQKSFFRNLIAFFVAFIVLKRDKKNINFKPKNLLLLILRSIFGTIGILANFYAIDNLILSDATMLNKLSPFAAIIFSFLILKEKIKFFQIFSILVAFIGSLLVIKPSLNLNIFPSLIGVFGAISAGIAYTLVRKLTIKGEKSTFIILFFSGFSCLITLPSFIFNYQKMEIIQIFYLCLAGIFGGIGQFAITNAYSFAPAKQISIFDYFQILFSAIIGFILFNQVPDFYSILGYFIIFSAAIFMFFINKKIKDD